MKNKTSYTTFRIGSDYVKKASLAARAEKRTVRAFIERALDQALARPGR